MSIYYEGSSALNLSILSDSPINNIVYLLLNIVSGDGLTMDSPVSFIIPTIITSNSSRIFEFLIKTPSYCVKSFKEISSGGQNVAVGANAADAITSGAQNTALGYNSLSAATTIGNTVAVGWNALALTTGDNNVSLGFISYFVVSS